MSKELLGYFKNRYFTQIQRFVQSEGSRNYVDGCLTVKHHNQDVLADFVKYLDEVSLQVCLTTDLDFIFLGF